MDSSNKSLSKYYSKFVFATVLVAVSLLGIYVYITHQGNIDNNRRILKKEAKNINNIISESFGYTNRINGHIGKQIAKNGASDLNYILDVFRQTDKIQNNNTGLFSWSSFDWVDNNNLQTVNSRLGVRKEPPNMSARQYTHRSPQNPWTLQVSFPVLGNPSNAWVIPAGTGVVDNSGKYLGAIIVGFNIAKLNNKIESRISSNTSFVVLDDDLNIVMQSSDNSLEVDDSFYQNNINFNLFKKKSAELKKEIKVGDILYSNYHKMDNYPYVVMTGLNKAFLKKEFHKSISPYILELISITILFLIVLHLFKTRIISLLAIEKKLQDSLHSINIAQTKLIRATSHDLKNYIFGISGMARMIIENKTKTQINKSEDLKLTKDICEQSEELMHFVEDLLDTNQAETGEFSIKKLEYCDIGDLIERMILLNKNMATQHKIEFKTDIKKNLPELKCDKRRFKQILTNLITNAIKYSPKDTRVVISAKTVTKEILEENSKENQEEKGKKEHKLLISIKDQGIGMTDEEIKKALSGSGEGIDKSELDKEIDSHGIGLPNVKQLVGLHKGILEIESTKGQGSTVNIYFDIPKISREEQEAIITNNSKSKDSKKNINKTTKDKSILVVDDTPINIKVTSRILRNAGYFIKHTQNGQEALKALDQIHFDLILMDGEMPIMDGYTATKEIRKGKIFKNFKNHKKIPIIAFMGNNDAETLKKVTEAGMNGHIDKGTTPKELLDVVGSYFENNPEI